MRKLLFLPILIILGTMIFGLSHRAMAQDNPASNDTNSQVFQECNDQAAAKSTFCQSAKADKDSFTPFGPTGLFTRIVQIIVWLVAVVSVLMIVIGGFRYVVSGGDSNAVSGAKNTIIYALIGLVVAFFAQVIVSFVLSQIS